MAGARSERPMPALRSDRIRPGPCPNVEIALRLDEVAMLLERQRANVFRVAAYRRAADTLRGLRRPVVDILEAEGLDGLERLPAIGTRLARTIAALATSGRLPLLERLRGQDPEALLMTVPGVGPKLADRLHHDLGIESLEALEAAAHDGRLERLAGLGPKRLAGIRDVLQSRLGRLPLPAPMRPEDEPAVAEILDVDREYRERARRGALRTIAPRRFNPEGKSWLPVLHARRGDREYTALFSNTARAHRLAKTRDWVVVYEDGRGIERRYTVVTAGRGALRGRRVVRGREEACAEWYASTSSSGDDPADEPLDTPEHDGVDRPRPGRRDEGEGRR